MPFKGTDRAAWDKAKAGKTPEQRRKIYQKEKTKNERICERKPEKFSSEIPRFPKTEYLSKAKSKNSKQDIFISPSTQLTQDTFILRRSELNNQTKAKSITSQSIVRTLHKPEYLKEEVKQQVKNKVQNIRKETVEIKYVPKQTILDDLREYRSSKIISNISNGLATIFMKVSKSREMTNKQMNCLRSSIALVTSETLNKALEKPLQIIDNVKMFIKIGKSVYKFVVWFNEKIDNYQIQEKSIVKVSRLSKEYRNYLQTYPKIKKAYQNQNIMKKMLGKRIKVIVDRPLGSKHPNNDDIVYPINYGRLVGFYANDGEEQDAYILGENKPLQCYTGYVKAIIHRLDDIEDKLVIAAKDSFFTRQEIANATDFQEKYFTTEIELFEG